MVQDTRPGDRVVYVPAEPGDVVEFGTVKSISPSGDLIMVAYDGDTGGSKATRPEDLQRLAPGGDRS